MTVITVSTVGFGEVHPLSQNGQWFTILLIFFWSYSRSAVADGAF
jgi:hypothetical protein